MSEPTSPHPGAPLQQMALPAAIRERIKREAEKTDARDRQRTKPLPARLVDAVAGLHEKFRDRPSWATHRKVRVPPRVAGDLIKRGRRAGLSVGTALDRLKQELPIAKGAVSAERSTEPNGDVSTVAIRTAVRQPSIFAPGHLLTALLAGGVIHIATTFAITALGTGSAFRTLRNVLPSNEFVVVPQQAPSAQVLPYLAPDMLYAFCRFDLRRGNIEITAQLPEAGWSLALYTRQGDNFYATPGARDKPTSVDFVLGTASDRLVDLTPGRRRNDVDLSHVTSPDVEGLVVIRAPLKGVSYEAIVQAQLKSARCSPGKA